MPACPDILNGGIGGGISLCPLHELTCCYLRLEWSLLLSRCLKGLIVPDTVGRSGLAILHRFGLCGYLQKLFKVSKLKTIYYSWLLRARGRGHVCKFIHTYWHYLAIVPRGVGIHFRLSSMPIRINCWLRYPAPNCPFTGGFRRVVNAASQVLA